MNLTYPLIGVGTKKELSRDDSELDKRTSGKLILKKCNFRWADLKSRIVEHNIRMMAKYYTKIRLHRMCNLLALSENETEDCLSDMVSTRVGLPETINNAWILSGCRRYNFSEN